MEFLNCKVNECLLVVNVAMILVSVASVQHHDLGCLVKADVEHVAQEVLFVPTEVEEVRFGNGLEELRYLHIDCCNCGLAPEHTI